jgi:hypothetical protein
MSNKKHLENLLTRKDIILNSSHVKQNSFKRVTRAVKSRRVRIACPFFQDSTKVLGVPTNLQKRIHEGVVYFHFACGL